MILVKDLKSGQEVWECDCGENIHFVIKEDARRVVDAEHGKDGYEAIGVSDDGKEVLFFQHHEITWYGPELYSFPAYHWGNN